MRFLLRLTKRHPSAILLFVQLLGVILYPFFEGTPAGNAGLNAFGIFVLCMAIRTVHRTPGPTWISVSLAIPVTLLLVLQTAFQMPQLLAWSSGLESLFYFYAAGSLIAYMMEDATATTDELYAAAGTFTLLIWGFTHLFVMVQALQPSAFSADGVLRTWSELNHLSFALLSSTGMGDVVAMSPHARSVASIEMMVGLMYLGTVVARLVSFTVQQKAEVVRREHAKQAAEEKPKT